VNTLLDHEFMLKPNEQRHEDLLAFADETRTKYTQAIPATKEDHPTYYNASDMRLRSIRNERFHALRPTIEENSELCEMLEQVGEWSFNTIGLALAS
jgi:hypothetical protein